ncbi:hypothetical protein J6590_070287 [Homalodisca vitripennis]|nr:hypothetical protein J6590_070287 [Homalodisca vitripennis]
MDDRQVTWVTRVFSTVLDAGDDILMLGSPSAPEELSDHICKHGRVSSKQTRAGLLPDYPENSLNECKIFV